MYDVVIIGAGVVGCAISRELSRYDRRIMVIERNSDVCEGTSKANSGIVHAGHDAKVGSMKAKMNIAGSRRMESLSKELDFPYRRNGSLVLAFSDDDRPAVEALYKSGTANGVEDLQILTGDEVRYKEPNLSKDVKCALYAPTGGIVDPFLLTAALAENAFVNGAEFRLNCEVASVDRSESGTWLVETTDGIFETSAVVNAAGVYADRFHNMVSENKIHITPRKGEYLLMDKKVGDFVNSTIFQMPTEMGKGVLVTPTVHGNLMIGPTSEDIEDKEGNRTSRTGLDRILNKSALSADDIPTRQVITSFAGLRAHEDGDDFIIEEVSGAPRFFDAAGIESPGLTSAPAIGEYVADLIQQRFPASLKDDFISKRKGTPCMATATAEERQALIAENPDYANIVCRCEMVTEGEILDAIRRPMGATTLDGIKRRVRAGMGRCQGGFCLPKQMEILAKELGIQQEEITKSGGSSKVLTGTVKE